MEECQIYLRSETLPVEIFLAKGNVVTGETFPDGLREGKGDLTIGSPDMTIDRLPEGLYTVVARRGTLEFRQLV
ncbi:unnamed protein product, partial [marine sediment metagenome]